MKVPPKKLSKGIRYLNSKINEIIDYVVENRVIPSNGWNETPSGLLPPPLSNGGGSEARSLRPYLDGDYVKVTGGYVDNNEPEIDSKPITGDPDADPVVPIPEISISGSPFYVWIVIEWEPGYTGTDPNIEPFGGTLVTPVEIDGGTTIPTDVSPVVDNTDGSITTNGKYHFLIATITGSSGDYTIDSERSGNRSIIICDEESVRCIWDSI